MTGLLYLGRHTENGIAGIDETGVRTRRTHIL